MSGHTIRRRANCTGILHSRDGAFTAQNKLSLWLQNRFLSAVNRFSPFNVIAPLLHSHHQLHTTGSGRAEGQMWQPSKSSALSEIGKHGIEKNFHLFFQSSKSTPCVRRLVNGLSLRTARQPRQFMYDLRRTKWRWGKFSPSTSVFPYPHHSTNILNSSASTRCSYQKTKGQNLGSFQEAKFFRKPGSIGPGVSSL